MYNVIFVVTLLISLSGCGLIHQNQTERVRLLYGQCDRYDKFTDKADCISRIAKTDKDLYKDPMLQELIAYSSVLSEKVKSGKMTETEANYEIQRKKNELLLEESQVRKNNASQYRKPKFTNCYQDGNSIECTSF